MLERKNEHIYLIVFLIIAMLIGFVCAYFLHVSGLFAYVVTAIVLTFIVYSIIFVIYQYYKKCSISRIYQSYLAQGRYLEILKSIDNESKEMRDLWEFKLLALFHNGNTIEFKRLYRNYMNEINECKTLERFQISLLHDILLAVGSSNKPVRFLKNTGNTKYKYTKTIDYQLYYNIYMGLKEYYQPQRNLVKVYFEKFLQQVEEVSTPLSFYLYYLMTLTMYESKHPLSESYSKRVQTYIYDDISFQLVNTTLKQGIISMQKGYQADMNRQRDDRDFFNDIDMNSPFDMENTGFRTTPQAEDNFMKKRHATEFQSDFDALNASVQNNNFNLYEDHAYDQIAPAQQRPQRARQQPLYMQEEEVDVDLDPTWFARSTINNEDPMATANFSMRNPRMQEATQRTSAQETINPNYQRNQLQQDSYTHPNAYQDIPSSPTYQTHAPQTPEVEPSFINRRTFMDDNQQTSQQATMQQNNMQTRNPMMNQTVQQLHQPQMQQRFADQVEPQNTQRNMNPQLSQTAQIQRQRMQNASMMQQDMVNTPQDRFSRFEQSSEPRTDMNRTATRNKPIPTPVSEKTSKRKLFRKEKKEKQDPFGFDNPNAIGKDPFSHEATQVQTTQVQPKKQLMQQPKVEQRNIEPSNSYRQFVKQNVTIAGMALLNAIIVSIASSSFVYVQFFYKYPINAEMISEIVLLASLVALLVAYLITGIHTGWTILKKPIASWSMVAKCLTSPFLLIVSLLIGAVSEIPYLIYASIKANNEKVIQ